MPNRFNFNMENISRVLIIFSLHSVNVTLLTPVKQNTCEDHVEVKGTEDAEARLKVYLTLHSRTSSKKPSDNTLIITLSLSLSLSLSLKKFFRPVARGPVLPSVMSSSNDFFSRSNRHVDQTV